MSKVIDLTGKRFGNLIVLRHDGFMRRSAAWLCVCDCGREKRTPSEYLRAGSTRSCGCLRVAMTTAKNWRHGMACRTARRTANHLGAADVTAALKKTAEYSTWKDMKRRCTDARRADWEAYGGRGIHFCERWGNFENFLADMGKKPSPKHTIDRTDNDGGYWCGKCAECVNSNREPNCRWATRLEQANNRRHRRWGKRPTHFSLG
jgi:hypothetical protein